MLNFIFWSVRGMNIGRMERPYTDIATFGGMVSMIWLVFPAIQFEVIVSLFKFRVVIMHPSSGIFANVCELLRLRHSIFLGTFTQGLVNGSPRRLWANLV